jgi:glycerol uptake facilitator-like aquaporin
MSLSRRLVAEGLGTAMLLAIVVGSGIMAERLAAGNVAIALLANAIATGAGLVALILMFGTISGAHFNPAVTLSEAWQRNVPASEVAPYIGVQIVGAFAGVAAAHLMFSLPVFFASEHVRTGPAQWWSEFVATFGLIGVIIGCSRSRPTVTPFAVAAYITAAYWFTSSTSFANPAVTLARAVTNTFAGVRPVDTVGYIAVQLLGGAAATLVFCWLHPAAPKDATVAGTVSPGVFDDTAERNGVSSQELVHRQGTDSRK